MSADSVRQKIVEAALDLFSEKGFDGTSIDEIAAASGMKAPNIYKYFKGKEDIFNSMTILSEEQYKNAMHLGPDAMIWIHNAEELKTFSMHQISFTLRNDRIRKMRKMCAIEQFKDKFVSEQASIHQIDNIQKQYMEIFDYLMKHGEIEEGDPELMAMAYYAPASILIQLCDREPEREEEILKKIEDYIDFFIERFFKKK